MGLFSMIFRRQKIKHKELLTSKNKPRSGRGRAPRGRGRPRGSPKVKWTVYTEPSLKIRYKKLCDGVGITISEALEFHVKEDLKRVKQARNLLKTRIKS